MIELNAYTFLKKENEISCKCKHKLYLFILKDTNFISL